ncbi:MAG: DUF1015 domain-containing protein [Clostridia bacterium]|nr:DUF1015 domain-containing protein [Clostridia bacterium]
MGIFNKADILLPSKKIDLTKWSVVACDQYTSQPEYWKEVEKIVEDAPSTLKIVFPEVYLSEGEGRISRINAEMQKYLENGVFDEYKNILIYVERLQSDGRVRRGVIGTVDLEEYDFSRTSKSLIRATEGTVLERIPPRVKIRENAPLELPHILILMNDEKDEIIKKPETCEKLYDFELMQNGGNIRGYKIADSDADKIIGKINEMSKTAYGNLLFAVGDGNHSLATAKTCWENLKKTLSEEEQKTHPARYCLVEIENIHQEAIDFEPIHRVVFGVNPQQIIDEIKTFYPETSDFDNGGQHIKYVFGNTEGDLYIKNSDSELAVGTLQKFLDSKNYKIDYIHGGKTAKSLAKNDDNIAFLLPKPDKNGLFKAVIKDGALPRKTFSMGEANDKRFYIEAKKIK